MTPPDRHTNPENENPTPNQNRHRESGWRSAALGADRAVRSGVDRVRPHAQRAWQRIEPLLRRIWLALLPLLRRVRGSSAWQAVERRVGPWARDVAAHLGGSGSHRSRAPRMRSLQAGAAVAALGVLTVAVVNVATGTSGGQIKDAAHVDKQPVLADSQLRNAPAAAPATPEQQEQAAQAEEPKGPIPGPPAEGIDVSNHNGEIDWKKVAASGQHFAFVLATDGTDFTSPKYAEQYHGAKDAGLIAGPYHFARPDESAEAQADKLLQVADYKKDGKSLPPVLDMEPDSSGDTCYGLTPDQMHQWTETFTGKVKKATGVDPIIYAAPSFWKQCMGGSDKFADHPLWLASYGVDNPTVPSGFNRWDFWQYTDKGSVDGIEGQVDQNHFQGSVGELQRLAK